jgi:hypothetical protein
MTSSTPTQAPSQAACNALVATCLKRLRAWCEFADEHYHQLPATDANTPDLAYFGTGYNSWGVQTNQKYIGAAATLATVPQAVEIMDDTERQTLLDKVIATLRFSLASHKTGSTTCTDGSQWGRTWISALGIERMMHAIETLWPHLEEADHDAVREMLASEADRLTTDYPVQGGLWGHKDPNKPESNIWNGAICFRAAQYNPEHPDRDAWLERAYTFFINGISIPADAEDETIVDGKPIRERFTGANFFPHYSLDHHGYMNVGYMIICISNIAMLHYSLLRSGVTPPESLYHHAADLWSVLRNFVFEDGRLARIGGDTRMRYCYCQDYLIPSLIFAADHLGDERAWELLPRAIHLIEQEQEANPGGSFLGNRLSHLAEESTYYYTRLEGDKAVVLALAADWLPRTANPAPPTVAPCSESASAPSAPATITTGWNEPEHGAICHRSPTRLASWCWRPGAGTAQGLCLPPHRGDLAEWEMNLTGHLNFQNTNHTSKRQRTKIYSEQFEFEGGFITWGRLSAGDDLYLAEGWNGNNLANHDILACALPDGHTTVVLERAEMNAIHAMLRSKRGTSVEIPNDLWNERTRTITTAAGNATVTAHTGKQTLTPLNSNWLCIDDCLGLIGLYGADEWSRLQRGTPLGDPVGSITTDTYCWGINPKPHHAAANEKLLDSGILCIAGLTAAELKDHAAKQPQQQLSSSSPNLRAALVTGVDNNEYLLIWNTGETEINTHLQLPAGNWQGVSEETTLTATNEPTFIFLTGRKAILLRRE